MRAADAAGVLLENDITDQGAGHVGQPRLVLPDGEDEEGARGADLPVCLRWVSIWSAVIVRTGQGSSAYGSALELLGTDIAGVVQCELTSGTSMAGEGEEPALPLPPSLTAGEAHLLPMERTSLLLIVGLFRRAKSVPSY